MSAVCAVFEQISMQECTCVCAGGLGLDKGDPIKHDRHIAWARKVDVCKGKGSRRRSFVWPERSNVIKHPHKQHVHTPTPAHSLVLTH